MAPRRKNASIISSGSTSSKAEPLPDWVKNKGIAKPPPKYTHTQAQQQQQPSKATTANSANPIEVAPARPPPLFPPNTKTPISLLNERIQKHHTSQGWLRPNIEAKRVPRQDQNGTADSNDVEKWTFLVILSKTNKADQSNPFTVHFDGRDFTGFEGSAVGLDSKEQAKHWGATYALFRLCSTMSLHLVLPSGPREYWKKLSAHKNVAPEHLSWLWAADPFEMAQRMAAEKESKEEARLKQQQEGEKGPRLSRAWQEAREVRMAKELRDTVEATVRKALEVYPTSNFVNPEDDLKLTSDNDSKYEGVIPSLLKLGFRRGHAKSACEWLKRARIGLSTSSASLTSITHLSDLDACLEYLTVFCPEEDLPKSFAPSFKADSFVTSSASSTGKEDGLAMRWIEDRMVKLAGYPRNAVARTLTSITNLPLQEREGACTALLLYDLSECSASKPTYLRAHTDQVRKAELRLEERTTLEAVLGPDRIKSIPASEKPLSALQAEEFYDVIIAEKGEDIRLRICPGARGTYPQEGDATAIPGFFVASSSLPAYLRLALTRRLGRCLLGQEPGYEDWSEMIKAGQGGVLLAMIEELESCWRTITEEPPELATVMKGVTVVPESSNKSDQKQNGASRTIARAMKSMRPPPKLLRDEVEDRRLKETQVRLWQSSKYEPMAATRANLPAMESKSTILSLLKKNRLLIIAGETGCGKTTQCPQFVLDDFIEQGQGSMCNIIVTQPRRLSAMGVAARVAAERCEDLDGRGTVGYTIRGERKAGRQTKLLFSTTGVLLRRLSQHDRDLQGISHIFVDEVHERGVESDLLLHELREVLQRNPDLRIILMSATIDQETFSNYFNSAPVVTIPGRTHSVHDYYLEDVRSLIGVQEDEKERVYGIDYNFIGAAARMVCERAASKGDYDGALLIFCPGVAEIRMTMEAVQMYLKGVVELLPLHANLTPDEQKKVFKKTRHGIRKIIVSTNVAETSITIDDVVYVIDLGLVKETRYDAVTGLTRLMEVKCSKAASKQRRGRAGRVRPGECFKLYTRNTEEYKMEAQQVPEIMRMSLENLILTVKALKGDDVDVQSYLSMALSPPSVAAIEKAVGLLGEMNIIQGHRLTALGKHVSLLPLDVRLAKMLVLGCIFHCLDPLLIAASIMSAKPLFGGPYEQREQVSAARMKFQTGSSDILTDTCAFQQWISLKENKASSGEVKRWCEESFISPSSLRDIASTRIDLLGNLVELGLAPSNYGKTERSYLDNNSSNINLQRSLLLAGLYPSVVRIAHPKARFDQSSSGAIQRESEARQVRYFDASNQRVFLHPSSTLFAYNKYQSDFVTYFSKTVSKSAASESGEKIYLRDASEVPVFAMLLFGGKMKIHRLQGGISMSCSSDQEEGWIKLRASARIATLVQHLRFLLDAALEKSFENPTENVFEKGLEAEVRDCLQKVLEKDGLS